MRREAVALRRRLVAAAADAAPRAALVRRGPRTAPRVALTFDDGPDERTDDYLDLLDDLEVRATFFLLGSACERRPEKVRAIVARGHEVAGHGFSHKIFPSLSARALQGELRAVDALLPPSPRRRALVRPPRGATSLKSLLRCARAGYTTVLWSLDSDDCRTTSPDVVVSRVADARAGDIVLLHEGQQWTLDALPGIVKNLRAAGLSPVTTSELLG